LIRYFPRLVCGRHNRVSGTNLRVAREWTKELCTSTPHLLWGVVAFTAVMVMGMLWLAWLEKQDSVLWLRRAQRQEAQTQMALTMSVRIYEGDA
jgi:hypothetical protein